MIFDSEKHLVDTFCQLVDKSVWTIYPETGDFDLLLVRKLDGFQIGIEAKMSLNAKVVLQAADRYRHPRHLTDPGPDCRAALVPWGKGRSDYEVLAEVLGIVVLRISGRAIRPTLSQRLPDTPETRSEWPEHFPYTRIPLPDYVPDVAAGVKGPTKLSMWKIKAIKLVILLRHRGYIVRNDFIRLGISPSIWTQRGWLKPSEIRGRWIEGAGVPDFEAQHPVNFQEISADFEKWNVRDLEGYI